MTDVDGPHRGGMERACIDCAKSKLGMSTTVGKEVRKAECVICGKHYYAVLAKVPKNLIHKKPEPVYPSPEDKAFIAWSAPGPRAVSDAKDHLDSLARDLIAGFDERTLSELRDSIKRLARQAFLAGWAAHVATEKRCHCGKPVDTSNADCVSFSLCKDHASEA